MTVSEAVAIHLRSVGLPPDWVVYVWPCSWGIYVRITDPQGFDRLHASDRSAVKWVRSKFK